MPMLIFSTLQLIAVDLRFFFFDCEEGTVLL